MPGDNTYSTYGGYRCRDATSCNSNKDIRYLGENKLFDNVILAQGNISTI